MTRYKKCSKNTMCLDTSYLLFIIVLLSAIGFMIFNNVNLPSFNNNAYIHSHNNLPPHGHFPFFNSSTQIQKNDSGYNMLRPIPNPGISYNSDPKDTLLNPYSPPVQYNQPHNYRQIGYLKNESYNNKMFPIFAKPVHLRRDKWYYYTIYDNIKLPIYTNGRKCSSEHGCDSLMNGDNVNVESLNDNFSVHTYDNHTLTYDPVI